MVKRLVITQIQAINTSYPNISCLTHNITIVKRERAPAAYGRQHDFKVFTYTVCKCLCV